jgi:hypothetical protein
MVSFPPNLTKRRRQPVLTMIRQAQTAATEKYDVAGKVKQRAPRPITLPKLRCLEADHATPEAEEG